MRNMPLPGTTHVIFFYSCRTHGMDGAHKRQQWTADLVVGDKDEAGAKRRRVQNGVAASGRKGQATQIRAATTGSIPAEVQEQVAKVMQAGSALRCRHRWSICRQRNARGTTGFGGARR